MEGGREGVRRVRVIGSGGREGGSKKGESDWEWREGGREGVRRVRVIGSEGREGGRGRE